MGFFERLLSMNDEDVKEKNLQNFMDAVVEELDQHENKIEIWDRISVRVLEI